LSQNIQSNIDAFFVFLNCMLYVIEESDFLRGYKKLKNADLKYCCFPPKMNPSHLSEDVYLIPFNVKTDLYILSSPGACGTN